MAVILGIDTGGTYTDSVLLDASSQQVLRSVKAFTTKPDLLPGIAASLDRLNWTHPEEIIMVCLSTTLATNAVVEQQGGRVGAFLLGRDAAGQIPAAKVCRLQGTLDIKGRILEDISPEQIRRVMGAWAGKVDAIAVSGFASVRNAVHESRTRDIIQKQWDIPVVCAHELSGALGFYERTVTAVLNAALIPNIQALMDACRHALAQRGIHAPVLIVKGDGSLMHTDFARSRPVETILSGPAASITGGLVLSGITDALLLDMGGTTTDLAYVENGRVPICETGAVIGAWQTHLRAAAVSTFGIGGDSRLWWQTDRLNAGPQRVVPLCVAGLQNANLAQELDILPETLPEGEMPHECYRLLGVPHGCTLIPQQTSLITLLSDMPHSIGYLEQHGADLSSLPALVRQGVIQRCGLTPTDLLHIKGELTRWDSKTAYAGAQRLAVYAGLAMDTLLEKAVAAVQDALYESCIKAGFVKGQTIVALGAPAAAWLPAVCRKLQAALVIPEYAEVANAVGAAAGQVMMSAQALVRPAPYHNGYTVHASWGNQWFEQRADAEAWAKNAVIDHARQLAAQAGSIDCTISCHVDPVYLGTEPVFIQTRIMATALGSPRWAASTKEC